MNELSPLNTPTPAQFETAKRTRRETRFRPASISDFTSHARHLAWLLKCPLQSAQEALAKAYGYENAYELRAEMKRPGKAGPYQAPTQWPLFSRYSAPVVPEATDAVAANGAEAQQVAAPEKANVKRSVKSSRAPGPQEDLRWMIKSRFEQRLSQSLYPLYGLADEPSTQFLSTRYLNAREHGVIEAGFFCSPKIHKKLFAWVKAGCLAQEGSPEEKRKWLCCNWPVGFWPMIRSFYGQPPAHTKAATESLQRFGAAVCPHWVELCRYRVPAAYLRTVQALGAPLSCPEGPAGYEADLSAVTLGGSCSAFVPDGEAAYLWHLETLLNLNKSALGEAGFLEVLDSIEMYLKSGLRDELVLHPLIRETPEAVGLVQGARVSELLDFARAQEDGSWLQEKAIHESTRPWPSTPSGQKEPTPVGREGEARLNVLIRVQRQSYSDTRDMHMSLWTYEASFTRSRNTGNNEEVGEVSGDLILPFGERYAVHPDDFFECLDASSARLNDVWKVLQGVYFPSKGYRDVSHFVQEGEGEHVIATAHITLRKKFRGLGLVPTLLNLLREALSVEGEGQADAGWQAASLALGGKVLDDDEEMELTYAGPGVPFHIGPSVFVLAVEGPEPLERVMRIGMRDVVGRLPSSTRVVDKAKEQVRNKLTRHFYAMQKYVDADIICYDPWDYPMT